MMEPSRKTLVLALLVALNFQGLFGETRFYVKMRTNTTDPLDILVGGSARIPQSQTGIDIGRVKPEQDNEKSRSTFRVDDQTMIRESLKANHERRNSFVESSTFDPDVLNKFLDNYANKIKSTTPKSYEFPFRGTKPMQTNVENEDQSNLSSDNPHLDQQNNKTNDVTFNSTVLNQLDLNDTVKRNKYFGGNGNANEDRNGWVTLDAIPWSKSKISKWQANPSSQRPWPGIKRWEKPSTARPWGSEFPSRPAYVNNEPWYDNQKPYRPDYHQDRPMSQMPTRPSSTYFDDRFDSNSNQAEKWPPERPLSSWDKFPSSDSYRPNTDIITDDRPSNFPNSWDKYSHTSNKPNKHTNDENNYPGYNDRDRFTNTNNNYNHNNNNNKHQSESHDWHDHENTYHSKFETKEPNFGRPTSHDNHHTRPHQSNYQYNPDPHPSSHPSSGDGQWVLLSTNHGYSKSRQRSLRYDGLGVNSGIVEKLLNVTKATESTPTMGGDNNERPVPVMTSKRQVRLTVLPSINGTNTATSHGGMLEVERTFKSVDQSQKEYEDEKLYGSSMIFSKRRPTRPIEPRPSNSAVLAAVGAGMVPATMAMMIPMMLGRKKRSIDHTIDNRELIKNFEFFLPSQLAREREKNYRGSNRRFI